jgi:hypothetical protein
MRRFGFGREFGERAPLRGVGPCGGVGSGFDSGGRVTSFVSGELGPPMRISSSFLTQSAVCLNSFCAMHHNIF